MKAINVLMYAVKYYEEGGEDWMKMMLDRTDITFGLINLYTQYDQEAKKDK